MCDLRMSLTTHKPTAWKSIVCLILDLGVSRAPNEHSSHLARRRFS